MRRKLLIGAISLLSLILLSVISIFVYIRSGRLDRYLQQKVVESLADVGVTAEIGSAHLDLGGYTVTLSDLKLAAANGKNRFGTIDSVTVRFSVLSYLHQRINITQVEIVHPAAWIEVDKQGGLNLSSIHAPPKKKETGKEDNVRVLTSNFQVTNGEINFVDLKNNITVEIQDLGVGLVPSKPESIEDTLDHRLEVGFKQAKATVDGKPIENITANVLAHLTKNDAEILSDANGTPEFKITSDLGKIRLNGKVESFKPLKYAFNEVRAEAKLGDVARVFTPETKMSGDVAFIGQVDGTGADYRASGAIEAKTLSASGFRVASIRVKTNVTGHEDEYQAKASIASPEVNGPGLTVSSITFNDATVKGKELNFDVTGGLNVASLRSGKITVSGVKGRLALDRNKATLSQFSAETLGGSVSGSATVAYGGGASRVDVQFKSLDLDQAATLASAKEVKVRGTVDGSAQLTFPKFNYKAAAGKIEATFDAAVSPPEKDDQTSPAKGEISLVSTGRGFNIERAFVRSKQSEMAITGTIGWDGAGSLNVNFKSADMAEAQRAIDGFGLIPDEVKEQYELGLEGAGEFSGQVEGKLSAPSVSGRLKLAHVKSRDEDIGSLESDIAYTSSLARITNASLVRPDGSRADFSVNAPLPVKDNVAVKANVENFDLAAIVHAVVPGLKDWVDRGVINGAIDLTGLPGARTIEGTAKLTLAAGEFNLPADEQGQEAKKVSVPEFTGDITLANSVINVQNLRMKIGESQIDGQGSYNLDTYEYSVNANGKNIDLAQVSDASQTVKLTGKADLSIVGQGQWGKAEDWSRVRVNATIQGHDVAIEGRDFGNAKLVAFTENGMLKVQATGTLLDQRRTLEATIDLRDRDHYPVNASIEFTEQDIGPYLGLIAPELSGVSGTATGTIKLSGPLSDTDRITAVATITKLEIGGAITESRTYKVANRGDIVITATPRGITLGRVVFTGDGTSVTLEGTLSRDASKSNLTVNGEINLKLLSSFTQTVFTTGIAQLQASIVGKLESPQLLGVANLRDIGVRILDFPLAIARGNGQVRFTSDQAVIEGFVAATQGGGVVKIQGGAALSSLAPTRWRLEVKGDQIAGEYPKDTQTVMDAQLTLEGNRKLQILSGSAQVRRASYTRDITIEELITTGGPFKPEFLEAGPGGTGGPSGLPTLVDLHITADNTLIIKNNLADAVGSAYLNLRGSLDEPQVSGRILLTRGTLNFRNGRYDLTRGLITIPGRRGVDPTIDFQTESDIRGYHIQVNFIGPIARLQTTVRSDPELPEPDIVSLILTGSISGDRSQVASLGQTGLGLAQSILSASLSEQLERGTQRLFGISRFSIDPLLVGRGNDPTARITVGQRITKDLTVTYSQNLTSGVSGVERVVLVEYRLSNRFSVVGFRNERGDLGFDVRLRKKF